MLKSHEKFHSANGKRLILVVDDEIINRQILGMMLQEEYEILYAGDGDEALKLMRENAKVLSLVLLDLMMPVLSGIDVLKEVRMDPVLKKIPIIVLTADQEAEVESLTLGASDFIPKPYPSVNVVQARVLRTIELSEDRDIIQSTERDPLTGLYNREYFYRYAAQFDQHHRELSMDALVVDVNHFHMINERFGTGYGDSVLRSIGEKVREMVRDTGGIVCRREKDTFLVYCPHGKDYEAILENAQISLTDEAGSGRVRLRMGVYANVDKTMEMERRFDRAKNAADNVRGSFTKTIGFYDDAMLQQELYQEQLIEDFHTALAEEQFLVFYQPKFDIRPKKPHLASAEALVRWRHPRLGMISPGVFIPLFEENGLIRQLDNYVWARAARQIRTWKETLGFTVPVSVNISRIDMYDPTLVDTLQHIVEENALAPGELLLEITESAYTKDSDQIIETVNRLRDLNFRIEMDDFGTGYSSLNMLSSLPIDALKLDMRFIRNIFSHQEDTRMLEVIIDIADYLQVPVIAEGVETKEQLEILKSMGCDMVQGYYFSRPVPPEEYEPFILTRKKEIEEEQAAKAQNDPLLALNPDRPETEELSEKEKLEAERQKAATYAGIAQALAKDYFSIYYVNLATDHFIEYSSYEDYAKLGIEKRGEDFFNLSRHNMERVGHPEDLPLFMATFTKENILKELDENGTFTLNYRLVFDGTSNYVSMKVTRMGSDNIVIGVNNIDAQMRREQELARAREQANRDSLTGVKSKHAYVEQEKKFDEAITADEMVPFAVAVLDVNDVKVVNDTLGHAAGDEFIRTASMEICNIFSHSPVFRYGGDEFVVIMRGRDYESRYDLIGQIQTENKAHTENGGPIIACGMAEFEQDTDTRLCQVFERADAKMYEHKKILKKVREVNG